MNQGVRNVLDDFGREVIGWVLAIHLKAELAIKALTQAIAARRPQSQIWRPIPDFCALPRGALPHVSGLDSHRNRFQ